jgi:hypothetical protein
MNYYYSPEPGSPASFGLPATALFLALLLAGCTQTRALDAGSPASRSAIEARAERAATTVVLSTGERASARALRLDADGASWFDPVTGEARSVPYTEVRAVRIARPGRGALVGLAAGALVGGTLGSAAALRADGALGGPAPGAYLAGGLGIGALLGTAAGWGQGVDAYRPLGVSSPDAP